MATLLNSFAFAQRGAFVSGFERSEMHNYLTHLANRGAEVFVHKEPEDSALKTEVIFIDIDKVVDEQGKPTTKENFVSVLEKVLADKAKKVDIFNLCTGVIGYYTDGKGNSLTVVVASDFIKNEAERTRSVSTTAAGYLHYLLNVCEVAYKTMPLETAVVESLKLAYSAVMEQAGNKFPAVLEGITTGISSSAAKWLLSVSRESTSDDTSGVFVGGGYGYVPAENPHVVDNLKQNDLFLADFVASNPNAILLLSDTDYDVKLTLKHQPGFINRDHFSNVYDPEMNKHLIIYVKYAGLPLNIHQFLNREDVRFIPGRRNDGCHLGTFHVNGKQYSIRTETLVRTGFMEDLYNMADQKAELVYVGMHLMFLLQDNVISGIFHSTKRLFLAFNAIEQLTGKPFHEQEWLLKHLGDKRFDAVKLRHLYNFGI